MKINTRHIKILKSSQALASPDGYSGVINRADAEECVQLGLVEPVKGYPLTDKGKQVLRDLN